MATLQPKKFDLSQFRGLGVDTDDSGEHGPLCLLKGEWHGNTGCNALTVPKPGGGDLFLSHYGYTEKMSFEPLRDKTPNRGDPDIQMVSALRYETSVDHFHREILPNEHGVVNKATGLHFENGLFLNRGVDSGGEAQLGRMFSVPHGDSVFMLGRVRETEIVNNTIEFEKMSCVTDFGPPASFFVTLGTDALEKMAPANEEVQSANMQRALEVELGHNKVVFAIEMHFDSGADLEGINNIPFIDRKPITNRARMTLWVQRIRPEVEVNMARNEGREETDEHDFIQIQYAQQIDINFNGLLWPHIDVNTLRLGSIADRVPWEDYPAQNYPKWFKKTIDNMSVSELKSTFDEVREDSPVTQGRTHHNNSALEHYVLNRIENIGLT